MVMVMDDGGVGGDDFDVDGDDAYPLAKSC